MGTEQMLEEAGRPERGCCDSRKTGGGPGPVRSRDIRKESRRLEKL